MNATIRVLRWGGLDAPLRSRCKSALSFRGLVRSRLALVMLGAWTLPVSAQGQFATTITFNADGTVRILRSCPASPATIPDTIGGGKVTSIGERAWEGCTRLTNITIPDGVTIIGHWAFEGCPLKDVLFNKSGTMLVRYPPESTAGYTIPGSVTHIAGSAFSGCENLSRLTIPDSVTTIGDSAFRDCEGLTSLTLADSVRAIGNGASIGCVGLTSVRIEWT